MRTHRRRRFADVFELDIFGFRRRKGAVDAIVVLGIISERSMGTEE